jgi:alpha-beta hydrolase superfamily lysophospholipase
MSIISRRTIKGLVALFICIIVVLLIVANQINAAIFSPPRRALQEYHMHRINNPADYGLSIRSHGCLDGQVPCLLVEPDGLAGVGVRGKRLRQQLSENGVELPAYGRVQGIIVLLHGRNGRKEDLLPIAERFVAAGFRCVLPDLPSHGDSPLEVTSFGSSEFERQLPAKVLEDIRSHFSLPDEPAALWGMSMGGAFAVNAAGEPSANWDAMMVVSSFSSLETVLESHVPEKWHSLFPVLVSLLGIERKLQQLPTIREIQPAHVAQQLKLPALLVHGDRDRYVRMEEGKNLYASLASDNKKWLTVPGGGHRSVLSTSMPLYSEMNTWLARVLANQ